MNLNHTIGYKKYDYATVLPHKELPNGKVGGGVVTREGKYLGNTSLHNLIGEAYSFEETDIVKEETVIFLGLFSDIWGHCITDNIRRVWFLNSKEYKNRYKDCKLVYIPWTKKELHPNFIKLLEIVGVKQEQLIPITKITTYKSIIIPDESFSCTDDGIYVSNEEYRNTINRICDYADRHQEEGFAYEKIYFSYKSKDKAFGEEYLEEFFQNRGYKVIAPEKYSFTEQLTMLRQCKVLASLEGSTSHNSVFLKNNSRLILIPRSYYQTGYQQVLNAVNSLDVQIIESSLSNKTLRSAPWSGPFCFYLSEELQRFFDTSDSVNSKNLLITYAKYKAKSIAQWGGTKKTRAPEEYDRMVEEVLFQCRKDSGFVPERIICTGYVFVYFVQRVLQRILRKIK